MKKFEEAKKGIKTEKKLAYEAKKKAEAEAKKKKTQQEAQQPKRRKKSKHKEIMEEWEELAREVRSRNFSFL